MAPVLEKASWITVSQEERRQIFALVGTDEQTAERDARVLLEWVNQQPHLPTLEETELPFLMTYLIGKKNSMEKAKKGLDLYYTSRTAYPDIFGDYKYTEEEFRKLSKHQTMISAPDLAPDYHRICYGRLEDCGPSLDDVSVTTELKVALLKAEFNVRLDWNAGLEFIFDIGNFSYHYAKRMVSDINTYRTYVQLSLGALPIRIKHIHLVRPPAIFSKTLPIVLSLFKEKIRKRIILHDDFESLHKLIPPRFLPKEMGGDLPSCIVTEDERIPFFVSPSTLAFCASQRKLRSDESKRIGGPSDMVSDTFGCEGSFRKLTLD